MGRIAKPENVDQQLRTAIATLDRSGDMKYFFDIKRRRPNTSGLWSFWKRSVSVEDIDDISEYCYKEGGDDWEYRVQVVDSDRKIPLGADNTPVKWRTLSALSLPKNQEDKEKDNSDDAEITERRKELRRKAADLELKRDEARLVREEMRLQKSMSGEDEEEEEEASPEIVRYDPVLDPNSPMFNFWIAKQHNFPFGMPNGQLQMRPQEQKSDMAVLAQAMITSSQEHSKSMTTILTALLAKGNDHKESSVEQMLKMKSLFPSMEPKDILGMISPMMGEMHKLQAESSKITMQAMADNQRMMNEKMLEMMATNPDADENDIERVGKLMGVGGEVVARVINAFKGTGVKKGDKVEVPALEKKPVQRLPAPSANGNGQKDLPPAEAAKQAIKDRVRLFLLTHEQEMLIESDPFFVVEKLAELWLSFPTTLRDKLIALPIDKVYEALREYEPEIVDRVLVSVSEDKEGARKKWCEAFWEVLKTPDDDSDDDDNDDDDDKGEPKEPDPVLEPEGAEK
jgi:hypothetical protein